MTDLVRDAAQPFWRMESSIDSFIADADETLGKIAAAGTQTGTTSTENDEVQAALEELKSDGEALKAKTEALHKRSAEIIRGHGKPVPASGGGDKPNEPPQ